jgi:hypothetical protein
MSNSPQSLHETLLSNILSDDTFRPAEPRHLDETGLSHTVVEDLICKYLLAVGSASGRDIAGQLCFPFVILEDLFRSLRTRQVLVHVGSAQIGDYVYTLTEQGRTRAQSAMAACAYVGAAPVTLAEYVLSVEAQTVRAENPRRAQLEKAFSDICVNEDILDSLGPAVNSGAGLFLYGEPGNGKTTLAKRITSCFGQTIFVPRVVVEDGQIIKVFDAAVHEVVEEQPGAIMKSADHDQRWVRIRRPTVIVGGELTLDALEIRHDPHSNVSEAPIQLKSNCGCLLIDDFGRQRVEPIALLNRWIVPLENRVDYLTLATGKKIQIPFEQLIIFSTNLEPKDLVDEAFLRRIPYKIEITDPDEQEFQVLFKLYADILKCDFDPAVVEWLIATHYRPLHRAMRRCHPRDLLTQIRNYCVYKNFEFQMRPEHFDRVVNSYFTVVNGMTDGRVSTKSTAARPVIAPASLQAAPPVSDRKQTEEMPPVGDSTPAFAASKPNAPQPNYVTEAMPGNQESPHQDAPAAPVQHYVTEAMPGNQSEPAPIPVVPVQHYMTEPMPASH